MGLDRYRLATIEEIEVALRAGGGIIGSALAHAAVPAPHATVVRRVLESKFGPPNVADPGEKSTWEWILWSSHGLLYVGDYKAWWSVGFRGGAGKPSEELQSEARKLLQAVVEECRKVKVHQKTIRRAKVGGVVVNPYSVYKFSARDMYDEAGKILRASRGKGIDSIGEALNGVRTAGSLCRAAYVFTVLSAEGFVNLLHTVFLRDRFRGGVYEKRIEQEQMPVKLLELDVRCHSFERAPFSVDDELFKAIQYLVNSRNLLAHAKVSSAMERHAVDLEGDVVFTEPEVGRKYGLVSDMNMITSWDVVRAGRLVRKMVVQILGSLDGRVRDCFTVVHGYIYVQYEWPSVDRTVFPLSIDDAGELEHVEEVLAESTVLDKDYYAVGEPQFGAGVPL